VNINSKRLLSVATAALALSVTMCATTLGGQPGTYRGTARGNNGPVSVEVVLDKRGIETVRVLEHSETPGISDTHLRLVASSNRGKTESGGGHGIRGHQHHQGDHRAASEP
jgi:uncharacterized protein with FMN-binding domain